MSTPSAFLSPDDLLTHVQSLGLDIIVTPLLHNQNRPLPSSPSGRYDEGSAQEWCERMDTLLGKLSRAMSSQPTHADLFAAANEVCASTIADVEGGIERQRTSDAAEAIRHQEEETRREEMATIAAARHESETQERLKKIEQGRLDIMAAERELAMRRQALHDAQQGVDGHHKDDDDDDDGSVATPEANLGTSKSKRWLEEETRRKLPQTTYEVLCDLCTRSHEAICTGPIAHACDHCWRQKKSCSNGGRRGRDAVVKAETRSPGPSAPKKRKIYSTTDANAIGDMDPIDVDFAPPQAIGKRNKTVASGSAHVEFDGIMLPPKQQPPGRPTRKSSRVSKATSKKNTRSELFTRLAQEFRALASTCEEIGEVLE